MNALEQAVAQALAYRDMILVIVVIMFSGLVLFFAGYIKIGREARFLIWENIFRSGGAIGIFRQSSGQAIFRHLKAKGRSLIHGKSGFAFLPTIRTLINVEEIKRLEAESINEEKMQNESAEDFTKRIETLKERKTARIAELKKNIDDHPKLNALIETQTILCNKPLVTGSVAAALAATPTLNEALSVAIDAGYSEVVTLLTQLQEVYTDNPQLKEFLIIQPWKVNQLQEFVNLSYTDADIDEAYQEGYIKGVSSYETYNKMLLIACVILLVAFIGTVFWLTK